MDETEKQRIENLGVISKAIQKKVEVARAEGYIAGYKAALRTYAWWKEGVQYVGTCGRTLKQALTDIERGVDDEKAKT